tara:strand:+ start:431 stop:1177 length:747 start_codon:yes stop_codon:yes gene_type:complete
MKKTLYTFLSLFIIFSSCKKDDVSDEFYNINGNVPVKLIKSINVISGQDSEENKNILFSYTSDGYLNTISDGDETSIFIYDDDELSNVAGGGGSILNIEELYESPYDAFENGHVVEYDNNGNPKIIEFTEEESWGETKIYSAEVIYDNEHNPYFFTLEAAKIIDVLDGVDLRFNMNPQVAEVIKARLLFPLNNPSQINYKNQEEELMATININYDYDGDDYPVSATATAFSFEEGTQGTYVTAFQYVD